MCRRREAIFLAELFVLFSALVFSMSVSVQAKLTEDRSVTRTHATYQINASKDDAWSTFNEVEWDNNSYYLSISDVIGGCRWKIDVPKGAIIEYAYFTCKAKNDAGPGPRTRVQVFDQDSCDDFDVIFWDWPVMPEYVDWSLPDFTADNWYTSPELNTIIQAYLDRPGYNIGNYLGLKFVQSGPERGHEVWAWDGDSDAAAKLEITYSFVPIANFTFSPEAPITEEIITFNASTSYDPDGSIVNYRWDFSDGNVTAVIDPTINHTFATAGQYNVTLTVTDSEGLSNSTSKILKIRARAPYFKYVIPIGLTLIGFLAASVLWKKRSASPEYLGFEFFDRMTGGSIPDTFSVMIIGATGSGKSVLCQQLAYNFLTRGKSCIYITYDCFPDEVRKNMKKLHWDTSTYEQKGAFKFIDCYSQAAGVVSREDYQLKHPNSLSELSVAISTAMEMGEQKSTIVVLDSTAPLFTRHEPRQVIRFLGDRSARIKGEDGVFFFIVGKEIIPNGLMCRLEEIVDCIVELDVSEEKGKTLRKMRVRKLRGRKFIDTWIYFNIEVKKGIVFSVPKKF